MSKLRCHVLADLFCWPNYPKELAGRLGLARLLLLFLLVGVSGFCAHAQRQLRGTVLDADTHEPLMAVSIRLKHSALGVTSRPDGAFSLSFSSQQQHDTLLFSRLGYASIAVASATLNLATPQRFYLRKQQQKLAPVTVTAPKWVERTFGISSAKALIHFTDGTMPAGKPFEIAQIMRVGNAGAVLTSANLYLAASLPDSVTVAVRFYRVEEDRPAKPLVPQVVRQRVVIRQGWLRLDLAPYKIYVTEDVALGLEFVPVSTTRHTIPYEIKLGGSAKSFARPVGEVWRVPPHHYRLYITARVPNSARPSLAQADDLETPASARLYSVMVQDSFSLFVRLPKDYARHPKRRYPVVFLLDANVYVEMVDEALKNQRPAAPAILVGVGYRDFLQMDSLRQRDYTYPSAAPTDSMPLSGGGKRFLAFLQRELVPYLDQTYRTDTTSRTLMGHSFGGYFAMFALVESLKTNANTFTQYVAASPSLYYGNQYLLRELIALQHLAAPQQRPLRLHLTIGEREMDVRNEEGAATRAAFRALVAALASSQFSAVTVDQHIYPNYGHMETAVPTFTDSVGKLFRKP